MENTQITLAPAAGAGVGKLLFDELLADPTFIPDMVAAARLGLRATTHRWIAEEKRTIEIPDTKQRTVMFFGLLAQAEGQPVQRIIRESVSGLSIDLDAELAGNPALRDVLERRLRNSTWKHSGNQAYKRPSAKRVEPEPANGAQHEPSST